jgi:hypothetical protein
LNLFHDDHLPKRRRISCVKFKDAESKWLRPSADVFLEVQKTAPLARTAEGNKSLVSKENNAD